MTSVKSAYLAIFLILIGCTEQASTAETKLTRRWALLIGVDDYANAADLHYCVADQKALSRRLKEAGFSEDQIFLMNDDARDSRYLPSQRNIEKQLELVLGLAAEEDLVVVSFSGHGVSLDGKSYLCPSDGTLNDRSTLVSLDAIYERLRDCQATLKIVLVDACRDVPTLGTTRSAQAALDAKALARSLQEAALPEGVALLTSCAPGETSREDPDLGHGVFMHYVLEGLAGQADQNGDDVVSLHELQSYSGLKTRTHVARQFNDSQRPFYKIEGDGIVADYALFPARPDPVIAKLDAKIRRRPDDPDNYVERGNAWYKKREFEKAFADYDQALKLDPRHTAAYTSRGKVWTAKGDLDKALADYDQAIKLAPLSKWAYNRRGLAWKAKGEIDKAFADFDRAIELDPDYAAPYGNRGNIWEAKGDLDKALADFNRAIELDPKEAAAFNNRGNLWWAKGEIDRALADYDQAISLDPAAAIAYGNRGAAWMDKGELAKALADYDAAIKIDPNDACHYSNRGNAWKAKGDLDKALADYDAAIKVDPNDACHYTNRGNAWTAKGDLDKALADYDQAIKLDPKSDDAFRSRALLNLQQRDSSAAADFRQVGHINDWSGTDSTYALAFGLIALRLQGDEAAAGEFLKETGDKLSSAWPMPCVDLLRGKLDEQKLLNLAQNDGQRTEAHCFIGLDYLTQGKTAEARSHFQWVADHGVRSFVEYDLALAELRRLDHTGKLTGK